MVGQFKNHLSEPLVSFVVNCYNGEVYLENCLKSIVKQTYSNWELIFWDNASTDISAQIFKSFNDARFKYYCSDKNVPLGQARAWAVEKCLGMFIAFLDVDDEWLPEKTSMQVSKMLEEDSVLSYSGIIEFYESSKHTKIVLAKHLKGSNFKQNLIQFEIQMPTVMLKRETLNQKKLNFDSQIFASEDYCLFMQLIINEKVSVIAQPLAIYNVRKESLTNKHIDKWAFERRYTLDKITKSNPNIIKEYKTQFKEAYYRADYYEAKYLISINKKKEAIQIIKPTILFSLKYLIIYLFMISPDYFWNLSQTIKYKRN